MREMTDPVQYYERRARHFWGRPGAETCSSIGERWKWYGACELCAGCAKCGHTCRGIAGAVDGEVKYCARYLGANKSLEKR